MTTQATAEVCRGLVRAARLHLVVARLLRFALGAGQDALVLLIVLRLRHLHRRLLLANLLLRLTNWTVRPHLSRRQRLEILGLGLLHDIWILSQVEENTHKPLLVAPPEQPVLP